MKTSKKLENFDFFTTIYPRTSSEKFASGKLSENEVSYNWAKANTNYKGKVKIEYDVVRPKAHGGDIITRNGHFIHFVSPDELDQIAKNIIFVIDKSGSMYGERIEMTKKAFKYILNDLDENDSYNLIYFDHNGYELFDRSRGMESRMEGTVLIRIAGIGYTKTQFFFGKPYTKTNMQKIFTGKRIRKRIRYIILYDSDIHFQFCGSVFEFHRIDKLFIKIL